jgi:hypothetical protein
MRICKKCNTRMARQFEDRASRILKPLIKGQQAVLTPPEQRLAAAWITKTALLDAYEQTYGFDPERAGLLRSMLLYVVEHGEPGIGTRVRIAWVDPPQGSSPADDSTARKAFRLRARPLSNVAQFAIHAYGHLGFELTIGHPVELFELERRTQDHEIFTTIWPVSPRSISWPPPERMGIGALLELRGRAQQEIANAPSGAPRGVPYTAEPLPSPARSRKRIITLRVVPEEDTVDGAVADFAFVGPWFIGQAPVTMKCGSCNTNLLSGVPIGAVSSMFLRCGKCRAYNAAPQPGELPEADAVSGQAPPT